jgi:uncharacterized ferredoxin-like protein
MAMDKNIMELVAGLMALSARTAPKAAGRDFLEIKVATGDQLEAMADACVAHSKERSNAHWERDGENIRKSDAVLLLALKEAKASGLNCGACGFAKCSELPELRRTADFEGPICAWRLVDLGIALGSAAKTAGILNADNRIMYRAGVVAKQLKLIEGELVIGIPISATGKSIYFDR